MKPFLKLLVVILVAPFAPFIAGVILFLVLVALGIWWELVKAIWGDSLRESLTGFVVCALTIPISFLICCLLDKWRSRRKQNVR
jgi:hypothetical protein